MKVKNLSCPIIIFHKSSSMAMKKDEKNPSPRHQLEADDNATQRKACQLKLKWQAKFFLRTFHFAYNKFSFEKDLLRALWLLKVHTGREKQSELNANENTYLKPKKWKISRAQRERWDHEGGKRKHSFEITARSQGFLLIGFNDFCVVRLFHSFLTEIAVLVEGMRKRLFGFVQMNLTIITCLWETLW